MEIKVKAEEYVKELQTMEKLYGREEDVYPWIYMLLRSAVDKSISIRDVHNLKKPRPYDKATEDVRKKEIFMRLGVGAPDFVLFDKEGNMIGCVEIKKMDSILFEESKEGLKEFSFQYSGDNEKKYSRGEALDVREWTYDIDDRFRNCFKKFDKPDQLCGHLEKYENVLYTDGKVFIAFVLKEVDNRKWESYVCPTANDSDCKYEYEKLKGNATATVKKIFDFNTIDDAMKDEKLEDIFKKQLLNLWRTVEG